MSAARGSTLPIVSKPSVLKNCMPPTRITGRKIIATKAIPRPPIQLSMPRHRLIPGGRSSSPTITVDPVVVMPETASNTASVNDSPGGPSMKGSAPNTDSDTQMPTVSTKACRASSPRNGSLAVASAIDPPTNSAAIPAVTKATQVGSPAARSSAAGNSITAPKAISTRPMM